MSHLRILPEGKDIELLDHEVILQGSLRAGIPHVHACGGHARCSTCRIIIIGDGSGCLPRNDKEKKLADKLGFGPEIRLACQTKLSGDVTCRRLVLDEEDLQLTHTDFLPTGPGSVGHERRLALLFADIRGFTALAESLPAYDVVHILNRYFLRMGKVIDSYNGVINNYMGDGLMALFGLTEPKTLASDAVFAALKMLKTVDDLQSYFQSAYKIRLAIGIGIHVGDVVVGRIGAKESQTLTAIGDAVNFASRIETANKDAGTSLLISAETYANVADLFEVGQSIEVAVKGKAGTHRLYEVKAAKVRSSES